MILTIMATLILILIMMTAIAAIINVVVNNLYDKKKEMALYAAYLSSKYMNDEDLKDEEKFLNKLEGEDND